MRFSIAASAILAAGATASYVNTNATSVVTEVVTAYTTYCPGPTTLTHGTNTYTVTEATTLTITDCPCTVTRPIITSTVTECNDCPPAATGTGVIPPPVNPPVFPNGTAVQPPQQPSGTGNLPSNTIPAPPDFTGAGSRVVAGAGAGLAGVLGLAFLL
ncbi:hypothetical protein D8B26_002221 [Coccidioides posadasii str. Silveira]|uniref:Uncharacterized protein n=2 Tax=Coccidioides posadasii TaxID=199306 RepID=E9DDI0_COCPS|nr:clock-controlled protein, putative [Coccidioides posadasii C735 delta SOWgp]EER24048.1 clock-controlled protein, putative [Coccidioides posadasii C735 delta SOWgp]EFW15705.1 conserved hypothetical protein [Coccidioides posadasii str. Silveira]QVM07522.1 hypothetical protein D8B26_002221 [Coccidioides posadasii str. Silveira]|eukprot:XP_003066193.1 clock-controlled protein, putative [Coccidioides posadasii C735 delta SOWgp]